MKKIIALILLSVSMGWADDTYTTNAGIRKPETGANDVWGTRLNNNFDIIDSSFAVLGGSQTFTGSITLSSATVSTLRTSRVLVSTPTYSNLTDSMALGGILRVGGGISGGTVNVCDNNFQNCSGLAATSVSFTYPASGSVNVSHDQSVSGGIGLRSTRGVFVTNGSNSPVQLWAKRLIVGSNYYTFGTEIESPDTDTGSIFQGNVYVGTSTISGTPKVAILGDTANSYSLLVGTSTSFASTAFQVGITTTGAVSFHGMTAAQIRTIKPNKVGEEWYCTDCATVTKCTSTGTVVGQVSAITSKATACN